MRSSDDSRLSRRAEEAMQWPRPYSWLPACGKKRPRLTLSGAARLGLVIQGQPGAARPTIQLAGGLGGSAPAALNFGMAAGPEGLYASS